MCHRPRPLRVGNPKLFLRLPLLRSSSHRHARSLRTSALDYARNFTSESRLSPRTASETLLGNVDVVYVAPVLIPEISGLLEELWRVLGHASEPFFKRGC